MDQLMQQTGMSEEDIEHLTEEMESMFEDGDGGRRRWASDSLFNMFKGIFPKPDSNRAEGERKEDQSQVKQEEQPQRAKQSKKEKEAFRAPMEPT